MDEKFPNQSTPSQPFDQPIIFKSEESQDYGGVISPKSIKTLLASFVMLFLIGGVGVGVYLVGQQQQLKSKASNNIPENLEAIVPSNAVNNSTSSAQATNSAVNNNNQDQSSASALEPDEADQVASKSATESNPYDFSDDGVVNSVDLSIMYAGWGIPQNDAQSKADVNEDGIINGIDYAIFLANFSKKAEN